jgi:hypothetical protein
MGLIGIMRLGIGHPLDRDLRHAVAELLGRDVDEHHIGRAAIGRARPCPIGRVDRREHARIRLLILGAEVEANRIRDVEPIGDREGRDRPGAGDIIDGMLVHPDAGDRRDALVRDQVGPGAVIGPLIVFAALGLALAVDLLHRLGEEDRASVRPDIALGVVERRAVIGKADVEIVEPLALDLLRCLHRHLRRGQCRGDRQADGVDTHGSIPRQDQMLSVATRQTLPIGTSIT